MKVLPDYFGHYNRAAGIPRRNVARTASVMSRETLARLAQLNAYDLRLYAYVKRLFRERTAACGIASRLSERR